MFMSLAGACSQGLLGEALRSSAPVGTAVYLCNLFAISGWRFNSSQVRCPHAVAHFVAGLLSPSKWLMAPAYGVAGPGCHQCAQVTLPPRQHPGGFQGQLPSDKVALLQRSW